MRESSFSRFFPLTLGVGSGVRETLRSDVGLLGCGRFSLRVLGLKGLGTRVRSSWAPIPGELRNLSLHGCQHRGRRELSSSHFSTRIAIAVDSCPPGLRDLLFWMVLGHYLQVYLFTGV